MKININKFMNKKILFIYLELYVFKYLLYEKKLN